MEDYTRYQKVSDLDADEIEDLYFKLMRLPSTPINTMNLDKCEKNYYQLTGKSLTAIVRNRLSADPE